MPGTFVISDGFTLVDYWLTVVIAMPLCVNYKLLPLHYCSMMHEIGEKLKQCDCLCMYIYIYIYIYIIYLYSINT